MYVCTNLSLAGLEVRENIEGGHDKGHVHIHPKLLHKHLKKSRVEKKVFPASLKYGM